MDKKNESFLLNKGKDEQHMENAFEALSMAIFGRKKADSFDSQADIRNAFGQIAGFYGKKATLAENTDDLETQLAFSMNPIGIMHRQIVLEDDWYRHSVYPLLVTNSDTGAYTALLPKDHSYFYYDSETGKKVNVGKKNQNLFKPEAICFYKPFPKSKMHFTDLMKFALSFVTFNDLLLILLMMIATTIVGLWVPRLSGGLMNTVVTSGRISWLLSTVFFLGMATVSKLLFSFQKSIYKTGISQKISLHVNAAAMMKIYALPVPFFSDYSSGELSQRIECINEVCTEFMDIVFDTLFTALFSLVYVTQISQFASNLLIPALLVILVDLVCEISAAFIYTRRMKTALEIDARERGMIHSMISGIRKIKVAGAEKRIFARWANLLSNGAALKYRPICVKSIGTAVAGMGLIFMYVIAVRTNMTPADYYAFNIAYGNVTSAFSALAAAGIAISKIKPTYEMAQPVLNASVEEEEGGTVLRELSGNIELNNVSFRYEDNQPNVIDKLSLRITAGQYVAIVGRTGCGKSTLIKLLLGFVKPLTGTVAYDGNSIASVDVKSLRSKIGTVLQNGKLFQGTVYSNIVVGKPTLTEEDVWKAAEIANIAEDIRKMPMGMSTLLTENGGGISGGQQQRLLIARAVASNPNILIFDEATSALDNLSQKKVSDALEQLHCTRIAVAHRLSTIRNCDRIVVLDKGSIAEDGTYDELMKKNGIFADLVKRQL